MEEKSSQIRYEMEELRVPDKNDEWCCHPRFIIYKVKGIEREAFHIDTVEEAAYALLNKLNES